NMLYSLSALAGGMVFLSGFYFLLELAIVHGTEYENAAEQRSYFGYKQDFLTPIDKLKNQVEFEGAGSLRKDADLLVKKTPNYYEVLQEREKNLCTDEECTLPNLAPQGEVK
ncbi:hypothetical protein ACY4UL_001842, partial [Campylobacter coli]